MAIKIDFLSNVRSFLRGTDDAEKALDDVADSLDDVAKAARDDDAERSVKDLTRTLQDAERASDGVADSFRDAARRAKDLGDAGDKAGKDMSDGMDRAGEGMDELKRESQSTATEAAASFDGSAESIGDTFQELAANVFAGWGPAGAVAGIALAAGIGLGMKAVEDATAAVEDLQETARQISFDALDNGTELSEFATGAQRVTDALKALVEQGQKAPRFWFEEDRSALAEFNDDLRRIGITGQDAFDIMSLGTADLQRLRDTLDKTTESADYLNSASGGEVIAMQRVIDTLGTEIETRSEAQEVSKALADSGVEDALRRQQAEQDAADAIAAATDSVKNSVSAAYKSLADDALDFATAEDGALDINRWLTYVQEHAQAVADYQENLKRLKLAPEEWSALMDMPEDQRVQWVDQLLSMPEDARRPFIDALDGMMGNAAASGTVSFDQNFNPDTDITITADATKANANADAFERNLASIKDKTVTASLKANTGAATDAINEWYRRNNGKTVTVYTKAVGRLGTKNYP